MNEVEAILLRFGFKNYFPVASVISNGVTRREA